jgi:hypothetical protein
MQAETETITFRSEPVSSAVAVAAAWAAKLRDDEADERHQRERTDESRVASDRASDEFSAALIDVLESVPRSRYEAVAVLNLAEEWPDLFNDFAPVTLLDYVHRALSAD